MSPTTRATPPTPGTPPTRGPSRRLKTSSGRRRPPGAWSTARPATAVANRSALPAGTPRSTPSCSSPPGWPAASAFGHDRSDLVGGRVGRSRRADALPGDPAPPRLGCGGASAPGQAAGRGAVGGSEPTAIMNALDASNWADAPARQSLGIDFSFEVNCAGSGVSRRAYTQDGDNQPDCDL